MRDQFGNELQPGDFITYPHKRPGSRSFNVNTARIISIGLRNGREVLNTKIWTPGRIIRDYSMDTAGDLVSVEGHISRSVIRYGFNVTKIPGEYLNSRAHRELING